MKEQWNIGDKCVYDGLVATVESVDHIAGHPDIIILSLVADEDKEMTCTVRATECESYSGTAFDQSERLDQARSDSRAIARSVDVLTDKYTGDCSF